MRYRLTCIVTLALICAQPFAHAQPNRLAGKFTGTGRACSGSVVVHAKTLSWLSSFSRCEALSYERIEQTAEGGVIRYSFRFTRNSPSCLYRYITISHHESDGADVGWEIVGYGSERSYLADKAVGYKAEGEDTLSCYLIRVSR